MKHIEGYNEFLNESWKNIEKAVAIIGGISALAGLTGSLNNVFSSRKSSKQFEPIVYATLDKVRELKSESLRANSSRRKEIDKIIDKLDNSIQKKLIQGNNKRLLNIYNLERQKMNLNSL